MSKVIPACLILGLLMLCGCPGGGKNTGDSGGGNQVAQTPPAETPPAESPATPEVDLVSRGREIYFGTEYSNTGLTCAHCHATSAADETGAKLIAHTGYGAAPRGSWKHTDQAQLDAKQGKASDMLMAANFCVSAPYMNNKDHKIEGQDGEALTAYLNSIADPNAWDAAPFVIEVNRSMPAAGLTANMENGKRIYDNSCQRCHDGKNEDLPTLEGAKDWLNPMQIMAKVRKMNDWEDGYADAKYTALSSHDISRSVALLLGSSLAFAQEGNPCAENPCGGNPAEGNPCGEAGHAEADEDRVFAENSMPFYASDILSDQDVVDVAFYIYDNV